MHLWSGFKVCALSRFLPASQYNCPKGNISALSPALETLVDVVLTWRLHQLVMSSSSGLSLIEQEHGQKHQASLMLRQLHLGIVWRCYTAWPILTDTVSRMRPL